MPFLLRDISVLGSVRRRAHSVLDDAGAVRDDGLSGEPAKHHSQSRRAPMHESLRWS